MTLSEAQDRLESLVSLPCSTPEFPPRGSRVAIYGAGNCGREVAHLLRRGGWEVAGMIDARADSIPDVDGIPCAKLGSDFARNLATGAVPIVLAVFNYAVDSGAIAQQLQAAGFSRVISYPELHETLGGTLSSRFWLAKQEWFRSQLQPMLKCMALWHDDTSRALFLGLVALRLTHDIQLLRNPDRDGQYFPADFPPFQEPLRFVDGGAYVGDSLPSLFRRHVEALAAFEPDPVNFNALIQAVSRLASLPRDLVLFPCGLDEKTQMLRFRSGQTSGSAISETGDTVIQVVALDEVLPVFAPNYIKLDIEGAELNALRGAKETIGAFRPAVAACIYHLPEHLWEVPFLLHQLAPDHRLSLRLHAFNGFDAVAYALPK